MMTSRLHEHRSRGSTLEVRNARRTMVWSPTLSALGMSLVLLTATVDGVAQTPFSLVNLGANVENYDARISGRGGWGMAESDTLIPAFKNLAGLAGLTYVAVLISGYGERREIETATEVGADVRRTYRVLTPNLRFVLPIGREFGAFSAGFRARRATQYTTVKPGSWPINDNDVFGEEQYQRQGTQFEIPLGVSIRFTKRIQLAGSLNLINGNIKEYLTTLFVNPSGQFAPSERVQRDEFDGASTSIYLLLTPLKFFRLGGSYTPAYGVTMKRKVNLNGVAQAAESSFRLNMPQEWAAGAALFLGPRWQIGADFELRAFSEFTGYEPWEGEEDEWTWSAGIERRGARVRDGGWSNIPFRLGVMRRHWGYRVGDVSDPASAQPQPVEETLVSIGTGFPFRSGMGHMDVAFSYGWVGDKELNGNVDHIYRLSISVAGLEKWW